MKKGRQAHSLYGEYIIYTIYMRPKYLTCSQGGILICRVRIREREKGTPLKCDGCFCVWASLTYTGTFSSGIKY